MKRRDVLQSIAGAVTIAPYCAAAQTAARTYRINMKTPKAMNFAVPNNVLSLTDEATE
jgi:hypothetical protein